MKNFGFIGAGNMAQAMLSGLIQSGKVKAQQISVNGRSEGKVQKVRKKWGVGGFSSNDELVDHCDIIFLCTKPQDLHVAIEPICSHFHEDHIVISLAAGIPLKSLKKLIPSTKQIVRVMTNMPVRIQEAVVGYSLLKGASHLGPMVEELFFPMGLVTPLEEGESFEAFTVATSSGVGFIFEQMIYWQEWLEEYGFSPEVAKSMTIQTFLGAAKLAGIIEKKSLVDLQDQIVSKKGVTFAGLSSMRELEINRALRVSFEKAALRDRELGETYV